MSDQTQPDQTPTGDQSPEAWRPFSRGTLTVSALGHEDKVLFFAMGSFVFLSVGGSSARLDSTSMRALAAHLNEGADVLEARGH